MGAKKLIYQISTALVVLLFTFAGLVKLVPGISPEIHNEMVSSSYFSAIIALAAAGIDEGAEASPVVIV